MKPEKADLKASRYEAQFSMGQYDYERFHLMLMAMDNYAIRCRMFDNDSVEKLYSILKQLYINFRPTMYVTKRKVFEAKFRIIQEEIIKRRKEGMKFTFSTQIFHILEDIMTELVEVKQLMGLGIEVRKKMSTKTIIRKGLVPKARREE